MKRVYKLTPVSMYDVRRLEQWLEEMAAKGLFLETYRPKICTFVKGEPKKVRYRLEPFYKLPGEEPPGNMVELFRECGWVYVGYVGCEMLIFSASDPHAPEPHTDPDIHLEQWNKLYQRARKDLMQRALFMLVYLAIAAVFLFWGGTPLTKLLVSNLTNYFVWQMTIFAVFLPLFELAVGYTRARELADVIRDLEGTPKKHRLWFPSRQFFSWIRIVYVLGLFLLLLCIGGYTLSASRPVTEFTPLYVTDLESGQTVGTDLTDYGFSPLCPHQRRLWEYEPTDDSFLWLETRWLDLPDWLSFLAVPAARDLLTDSMKLRSQYPWRGEVSSAWTTREHPDAGADWMSTADSEDGVYHTAAAALGDKVVLVRYVGSGDLTPYLDEIVAMIR